MKVALALGAGRPCLEACSLKLLVSKLKLEFTLSKGTSAGNGVHTWILAVI